MAQRDGGEGRSSHVRFAEREEVIVVRELFPRHLSLRLSRNSNDDHTVRTREATQDAGHMKASMAL